MTIDRHLQVIIREAGHAVGYWHAATRGNDQARFDYVMAQRTVGHIALRDRRATMRRDARDSRQSLLC
jgi:hypothetical protein